MTDADRDQLLSLTHRLGWPTTLRALMLETDKQYHLAHQQAVLTQARPDREQADLLLRMTSHLSGALSYARDLK